MIATIIGLAALTLIGIYWAVRAEIRDQRKIAQMKEDARVATNARGYWKSLSNRPD